MIWFPGQLGSSNYREHFFMATDDLALGTGITGITGFWLLLDCWLTSDQHCDGRIARVENNLKSKQRLLASRQAKQHATTLQSYDIKQPLSIFPCGEMAKFWFVFVIFSGFWNASASLLVLCFRKYPILVLSKLMKHSVPLQATVSELACTNLTASVSRCLLRCDVHAWPCDPIFK